MAKFPCHIIGLMSGTSADGVDAALLYTDGETVVEAGASAFVAYDDRLRRDILALMGGEGDRAAIAHALTRVHVEAVRQVLAQTDAPVSLIGFHGQTIVHAPHLGITDQIGDAQWMADTLQIPVVADFRSADVAAGGQGAPLVPLYHAALTHALLKPLMVVNIGGVANVTWIGQASPSLQGEPLGERGGSESLPILAFDCGPGNALLDDWVSRHTTARYDHGGRIAAAGRVDEPLVQRFLADPFFAVKPPKSLDRNHFYPMLDWLNGYSVENGAATLTAMTAAGIVASASSIETAPIQWLIAGGGRHNPVLMRELVARVPPAAGGVIPIDTLGWDGDMLEAQAFAYLAARSVRGLPLSLPTTTGVSQPVTGGVFYPPEGVDVR